MTGSEMVVFVRELVEDTSNWSEARILVLLNRAYEQIIAHLDAVDHYEYFTLVPLTLVSGTKDYTLATSTSWRKIVKVMDEDNLTEINLIDPREWPNLDSESRYRAAWVDKTANKLKFFEDPPDTNTYNIYYIGVLDTITTSSSPAYLDSLYHQLIPLKAALLILKSELQSSNLKEDYGELLQRMLENSQPGVRMVRDVRG